MYNSINKDFEIQQDLRTTTLIKTPFWGESKAIHCDQSVSDICHGWKKGYVDNDICHCIVKLYVPFEAQLLSRICPYCDDSRHIWASPLLPKESQRGFERKDDYLNSKSFRDVSGVRLQKLWHSSHCIGIYPDPLEAPLSLLLILWPKCEAKSALSTHSHPTKGFLLRWKWPDVIAIGIRRVCVNFPIPILYHCKVFLSVQQY